MTLRSRAPVNNHGAIVGTASLTTTAGTTSHGVMLLPIEFVTDDGSGGFAQQTFTYNGTATPIIDTSSSTARAGKRGQVHFLVEKRIPKDLCIRR